MSMLRILHDTKYDFIKYWKHAAILTIGFIVLGFAFMGFYKARTGEAVNYSIEFTGGTVVQLAFAKPPTPEVVRAAVDEAGYHGAEITRFGTDTEYVVKAQVVADQSAANADSAAAQMKRVLEQRLGANTVKIQRTESVGPRVGEELKTKAFVAILISFIVTLIYLAFRFEWRFGVAAVAATAHDILTTLAFLSMLHLEVSLTVVAALLTVVGYSLHDTIIIFDRVRENLRKARKE